MLVNHHQRQHEGVCEQPKLERSNEWDFCCLKENLNASRPSEHPSLRGGKKVKTFRWEHRLQIQNLFIVVVGLNVPSCFCAVCVHTGRTILYTRVLPGTKQSTVFTGC